MSSLLNRLAGFAPLLAIPILGCGYLKDRGRDFLDPLGIQFSRGRGWELNVRVTHFVQAGFSLNPQGSKCGFLGRKIIKREFDEIEELGFSPVGYFRKVSYSPFEKKTRSTTWGVARSLNEEDTRGDPPRLNPIRAYEEGYDRRLFDVGFSVPFFVYPYTSLNGTLVPHGMFVHMDFNPYEIADLVLGLFTIDISGDDGQVEPEGPASEP